MPPESKNQLSPFYDSQCVTSSYLKEIRGERGVDTRLSKRRKPSGSFPPVLAGLKMITNSWKFCFWNNYFVSSSSCQHSHIPNSSPHAVYPGWSGKPPYPSAWDKSHVTLIHPALENRQQKDMPKASLQWELLLTILQWPHCFCCDPKWQTEPASLCSCTPPAPSLPTVLSYSPSWPQSP